MKHRLLLEIFLVNTLFVPNSCLFFDVKCPDKFSCLENRKIRCIDIKLVCNHVKDCLNGDDEDYCDQNICRKNEQLCLNGVCIPKYYHPMRCDGKLDCTDGSDESGCPTTTHNNIISVDTNSDITIEVESKEENLSNTYVDLMLCDQNQFRCNDGHCLLKSLVCDNISHCNKGEDEDNLLCEYFKSIDKEQRTSWLKHWDVIIGCALFTFYFIFMIFRCFHKPKHKNQPQMNQLDHINDQLDQASFMDQELNLSQSEPAEASEYAYPQFETPFLRPIIPSSQIPMLPTTTPPNNKHFSFIERDEDSDASSDENSYLALAPKSASCSAPNLVYSNTSASFIGVSTLAEATKSMEDTIGKERRHEDYFVLSHQSIPSMNEDTETQSSETYDSCHYLMPNEARPKSTIISYV